MLGPGRGAAAVRLPALRTVGASMSSHLAPPDSFAPPGAAQEVSDGIYAYVQPDGSWWINNTGFLVGRRGVVSVDACSTQRRTLAYLDAIAKVTSAPVRTLINTHHHGDHTFGNCFFPGATIVGHDNVRAALFAWGAPKAAPIWTDVDWGEIELEPPFVTYEKGVSLYVDELRCEVAFVGTSAHTDNDSYVWVPERKLLFSGDVLFNGGTPFLVQGSVSGELAALDRLASLGAETIVPGHGGVCGPGVIERVREYVRFVQDTARAGHEAGIAPLEPVSYTHLT